MNFGVRVPYPGKEKLGNPKREIEVEPYFHYSRQNDKDVCL